MEQLQTTGGVMDAEKGNGKIVVAVDMGMGLEPYDNECGKAYCIEIPPSSLGKPIPKGGDTIETIQCPHAHYLRKLPQEDGDFHEIRCTFTR